MKVFEINDLTISLDNTDLANLFNVYNDVELPNNALIYNLNRTINISGLENISSKYINFYQVAEGDTFALISYKHYATTRLWWLIAKTNGITNPFDEFPAGTIIKVLKEDIVRNILSALKAG